MRPFIITVGGRNKIASANTTTQPQQSAGGATDYGMGDLPGMGMDVEPMDGTDDLISSLHVRNMSVKIIFVQFALS